jgi:hypothetical protein
MSVPYKNPISSVQVSTPLSVSRTSVFGTNFSNLNVGGYMEVYNLSDLSLTLTASSYPSLIQLSANTIPIRYTKGNGTFLSPDYLTLNSDNISSGRRRIGMMVYVHETDKVYQYVIPNYDTLWNNLSGLTGFSAVTYSDYTTVVNSRSSAGQSFIQSWTASTIEGVGGYTSANANWRIFQTGGGSTFSGGTVTGPTIFTNGLSANTISATTYYNLPPSTFSGGTVTGPTNFTNGLTANTISATTYYNLPSSTGAYLPLSGGTVFGNTIFTSGLTANTLNINNYIDFNTGTTNPSAIGGRVFFDNNTKSLSYYGIGSSVVPISLGQQLYVRVWNATGTQIDKGKVISITGTSNNLPSAKLATNNHTVTSARPVGLAAENIPNNSEGLVIVNGILSGITLNTFANGDTLYLSDTVPGGYVNSTTSLSYTARTNEIGYVIQTGTTTGKIYVTINNEDSNLTLTDIERNILEGNVISSGVYEYTGMTQGTGQTINVAYARGWIVKNTYGYATLPDVTNVYYTGGTNIPLTYLNSADATYILINSGSTLVQQTTFPIPQQRRENIFIGKVVHPNRSTITSINQTVDFDVSPMAAIRDLWTPLKLINQGIIVSANGANLSINTSAGTLWGNGIGWITNQQNPDSVSISGTTPTTFQYRTQTGGTFANTTTIDVSHYDVGGVVTSVGGGPNSSTNQRVYLFPTGLVRIQYGQQVYGNLAAAVAGSQTEQFVEYGNNRDNGILIGILSVNKNATDLSDTGRAVFNFVSKFGEIMGGTGGLSTTTLQQAYDNSSNPEIVTNSTLGSLTLKNGTGNADNVSNLFEGQNTSGTVTSFIRADGGFSGLSISATTYYGLPTDIRVTGGTFNKGTSTLTFTNNTGGTFNVTGLTDTFVTGGTYSNGTATFTNNTGGTFNVTGITTSSSFTGGTVSGATNFTGGLTANTISATTYQNLPTDIRVTGGTYSSGTATFTNNTGGTFNVTGFSTSTGTSFTGGTVSGATNFTGGLTANTISATTYQNLPTDIRVTGGTYSNGTATFTNNTGGTFNVTGFKTNDVFVTGATYSNNTFTYTNNTGGTFGVLFNTMTGLTATTISATTYFNLPTDIRVTGGTYSGSTIIFTNNTGGTFSVTGITTSSSFTGGTVSGATNFTNGLTANTISATTYQNLPSATFSGGTVSGPTNFTGGLTANTISATTITSPSIKTYGLIVATSLGYQNIF